MQIVIKLSEKALWYVKGGTLTTEVLDAVRNGIPLPKDHGRLGDLDELEARISGFVENDKEYVDERTLVREKFILDGIKETRTIIEADKEGIKNEN